MRPTTVADACRRVKYTEDWPKAMGEFLQTYYLAKSDSERVKMLEEEPPLFKNKQYNALVAGIAEYLYKRSTPNHPPKWIGGKERYLTKPWFAHNTDANPGLCEYLTFASPPEFKSRNIMTDEEPLRRAIETLHKVNQS